ncbi:hypothetical protein K0M31_011497 [Melipona bicolor]|uniref:Uncharacterized protein n=1 Tax=Melipona bicolor TaxID=60889 RepID=A0AA40KUU7_9HYME|nr:hypothetical protein K0M31_011497 [Melipona bicolor]
MGKTEAKTTKNDEERINAGTRSKKRMMFEATALPRIAKRRCTDEPSPEITAQQRSPKEHGMDEWRRSKCNEPKSLEIMKEASSSRNAFRRTKRNSLRCSDQQPSGIAKLFRAHGAFVNAEWTFQRGGLEHLLLFRAYEAKRLLVNELARVQPLFPPRTPRICQLLQTRSEFQCFKGSNDYFF